MLCLSNYWIVVVAAAAVAVAVVVVVVYYFIWKKRVMHFGSVLMQKIRRYWKKYFDVFVVILFVVAQQR